MVTATKPKPHVLKTYDDLCAMPEDGMRYELIGGEIVMSPSPPWFHQEVILRLYRWLHDFAETHALGRVGVAPLDIHLSPHDTVQPDVVFVRNERFQILTDNGTRGAPDLVVEVLSPSNRKIDEGRKFRLYEAAGVLEYWIADAPEKQFHPFTLTKDGYRPIPVEGNVFRSILLPDFLVNLDALCLPR